MLDVLHKTVLAEGNYYWGQPETPKPATFKELHRLYRDPVNELVAINGTHSVLDVFRLFPAGHPRWLRHASAIDAGTDPEGFRYGQAEPRGIRDRLREQLC